MDIATSSNDVVPLTACWPLSREGPMPKTLLGPEYLEKVFSRIAPVAGKCSAPAVRKPLNRLLKHAGRKTNRAMPIESDTAERDRMLATAVCADPRMRERIRDLEIGVEE